MKIGDFSQSLVDPPKPAPTASTAVGASPEKEKLDSMENRLEKKAEETEEALKPKLDYEAQLKQHGISTEEAANIVDAVLFHGYYSETIKISSRISVVLRTRQARDTTRTLDYLEVARPMYDSNYNEVVSKYALAGALERLGDDRFSFPGRESKSDDIEEAFQQRLRYVEDLPDPVLRLLYLKMQKFDERVRIVLQEGAIENF